jgi:hypothetical protein
MDPYEVEQYLYALGLDGPKAEYSLDDYHDVHDFTIDWGSDLRQMNRLVQRICDLGYSREALKAWCCSQAHCTAEDALRASYNMGSIMYMPGMDTDEELGEFALENGMIEEYNSLPDDIYDALDKTKVGAKMREMEGGVFVNGGYFLEGEDFSGEPLPAEEPIAYFQVRFSDEYHDSGDPLRRVWEKQSTGLFHNPHDVPLSDSDERLIARTFGREDLSGLPIENRSIIPYLNGMISGVDELPELDLLNEALTGMNKDEIQKYKALLEVVGPGTPSTALRLADEMGYYDVTPAYADPANYGLQHAAYKYGLDADCRLLDYVDLAGYGAEMLRAEGYEATRYGAVYRNAMAMKHLAGPNIVYSGDYYCGYAQNYSVHVCWDPDAQKVWLELNDVTADDETYSEDLARYQMYCEDWGVRDCVSANEYDLYLSELGAVPYDEAMAEEPVQGMGGMAGMT